MNLKKKKELASKVLKAGKNRISFTKGGLSEIKEAITKQDIKDLFSEGIIVIKSAKGRKKIKKRKTKRGPGKIKKKLNKRKQIYVKITRKLRTYLKELRNQNKINKDLYWELRKKLKMRVFKSKAQLKEYINNLGELKKEDSSKEKQNKKEIKKTKTKLKKKTK